MTDPKEPNRTLFLRGLPLDITSDKLLNYCGPTVELNEKGKPLIFIFDRKGNSKTVSAKVSFAHNVHAKAFLRGNNRTKFPNCEERLHVEWFGENKVKNEVKANSPQQAAIVDGLPKTLDKRALLVYFQNEVGEVKTLNSQPMIDILEKKGDSQKVRVWFHSVAEARMCRLKLDGNPYNGNHDFTLRISIQEPEPTSNVTSQNKPPKESRQKKTDLKKDVPISPTKVVAAVRAASLPVAQKQEPKPNVTTENNRKKENEQKGADVKKNVPISPTKVAAAGWVASLPVPPKQGPKPKKENKQKRADVKKDVPISSTEVAAASGVASLPVPLKQGPKPNKDPVKPKPDTISADAAFYAVHISNLPISVEIPPLFFFLTEHVTGISRWDNWVPKIKILNRDNGMTCAMVTFDTDFESKECILKLNGVQYNDDVRTKLKLRPFFEKTRSDVGNRAKCGGIAELSLDDLPGPHHPEATEIVKLSPRKEKTTFKKGASNSVAPTFKVSTLPDNVASPTGCKVLILGLPLGSTEATVMNLTSEPIIRTPQGSPLIILFQPKPNAESQTVLVHMVDKAAADRFIQDWNGKCLPATTKRLAVRLYHDRPTKVSNLSDKAELITPDINGDISPQKQIIWNVVFVAGLPKSVTQERLKDIFKHCGEIRRINLFENEQKQKTGCGTVSFANMGSAERCINIMNNSVFPGYDRQMKVKFFEASVKQTGRRGQQTATCSNGQTSGRVGTRNSVQEKAFDCIVCFETCEEKEMIGCVPIDKKDFDQDSHYICMECARLHAEALITDGEVGRGGAGLPCCTDGCARVIMRAHVMKLLDTETARLLDKRMTSVALLGIAGIEYCIRCDYGEFIEANTIQVQYFHCRNALCRTSFCRKCKVDIVRHRGKTCDGADPNRARDRARKQYEEELSATVIRICPTCKTQFQKLDGCNKMVCQNCNTTMCYLCRETGINYDHFRYGSKCGQDTDSTAYDRARLNEVRSKYSSAAGGSRNTAGTSVYSTAYHQRAPHSQTGVNNPVYQALPNYADLSRPPVPQPQYGEMYNGGRDYATHPIQPEAKKSGCTIC